MQRFPEINTARSIRVITARGVRSVGSGVPKPYVKRTFDLKHLRDTITFTENATRQLTMDDLFLEMAVGARPDEVHKTGDYVSKHVSRGGTSRFEFAMETEEGEIKHYVVQDY